MTLNFVRKNMTMILPSHCCSLNWPRYCPNLYTWGCIVSRKSTSGFMLFWWWGLVKRVRRETWNSRTLRLWNKTTHALKKSGLFFSECSGCHTELKERIFHPVASANQWENEEFSICVLSVTGSHCSSLLPICHNSLMWFSLWWWQILHLSHLARV